MVRLRRPWKLRLHAQMGMVFVQASALLAIDALSWERVTTALHWPKCFGDSWGLSKSGTGGCFMGSSTGGPSSRQLLRCFPFQVTTLETPNASGQTSHLGPFRMSRREFRETA